MKNEKQTGLETFDRVAKFEKIDLLREAQMREKETKEVGKKRREAREKRWNRGREINTDGLHNRNASADAARLCREGKCNGVAPIR